MAVTLTNAETTVNSSQLGGTQTNAQTVALKGGGYVTAWDSSIAGNTDVFYQIFDGAGNKVGGAVRANSTLGGNQILRDIVVTADGRFTLAWTDGLNAVTRSFNAVGTATSAEKTLTSTGTDGAGAEGVQLIATGTSEYKVVLTSSSGTNTLTKIETGTFTTAGVTVAALSTINTVSSTNAAEVTEVVASDVAGSQIIMLSDGQVIGSNGTVAGFSFIVPVTDFDKVQDGMYLVGSRNTSNFSAEVTALFGTGADLAGYAAGTSVSFSANGLSGISGASTAAMKVVNLGGGRILGIWAAQVGTGGTITAISDIYARVFDLNTGQFEGGAIGIGGSGFSSINFSSITISADVLGDGRVAVSWSAENALSGFDTFTRILDPRDVGVTVTGTGAADIYVGSAFDDTFTAINVNDSIDGGNGLDTVVLANVAWQIDLQDAGRFTGAPSRLTNIENLTGSTFADEFHGTTGSNALLGSGGDDRLYGRAGNDALNGGDGADILDTGAGNDTALGGIGDDQIVGGQGADLFDGEAGNDRIDGGSEDDTLYGGAGLDQVFGRGGNDFIDGGIDADVVIGGDGDDIVFGGDGDDVLNGDAVGSTVLGNDTINGGAGNDRIDASGGTDSIDGGAGTDTLTYVKASSVAGFSGIIVDLDVTALQFGELSSAFVEDDTLTGIENLTGSFGDDFIGGSSGANVLRGGGGSDILLGRAGTDTLFGGAGSDVFMIDRTNGGADAIKDFLVGTDKIGLATDVFGDINASNIGTRFSASASGAVAANGNAQLTLQTSGGNAGFLRFDADGNGAGAAVVIGNITFANGTGLASFGAGDFLFL